MKKSEFKQLMAEAMEPIVRKVIREELSGMLTEMMKGSMVEPINESEDSFSFHENGNDEESYEPESYSISEILKRTKPFAAEERTPLPVAKNKFAPKLEMNEALVPAEVVEIEGDPMSKLGLKPVSGKQKEVLDAAIDNDASLSKGEKLVMKALTKDYRAITRHMNETKGAARKTVYGKK